MGRVLLIGLQTASVDFERWPQLTPEKLNQAAADVMGMLRDTGFEPRLCLVDDGLTAEATVRDALLAFRPDVVSIGAGVRADPHHLGLFEAVVNLVHELAPQARFAFNTHPMDTVESVQRAAGRKDPE